MALASCATTADFGTSEPAPAGTTTIRVLHVINGEHYAGAERVQDLLALRLPEFGFDIDFACLKPGRFPLVRQSQNARLFNLAMQSRFDLQPVLAMARHLREGDYQLVHTHTPRAALVGRLASALAGVPLVHHVHSPTNRDTTHRWRNAVNTIAERVSLCRVARVIAVSHSLGWWARQQGYSRRQVAVVANGVPSAPALAVRSAPRHEWTLGMVALFRPRKGLEVLLEALAQLRAEGCLVRLRAVGGFETEAYRSQVLQHADRLHLNECIDWIGFTSQVSHELQQMDLFVLPSLFGEGLPMVVLEAMAAGVPVVASRVEGVPEVIRHECEGILVEPGNPQLLARSMARVILGETDWHTLRQAAYERQRQGFSDYSMAQGVAEVYRQLLLSQR